jgi:hypothetical protein
VFLVPADSFRKLQYYLDQSNGIVTKVLAQKVLGMANEGGRFAFDEFVKAVIAGIVTLFP